MNYILVVVAVIIIACIYLFWLSFKNSNEIQNLRITGGGCKCDTKEQSNVVKTVGQMEHNLNELNKFIFGSLVPRLNGDEQEFNVSTDENVEPLPEPNITELEDNVEFDDDFIKNEDTELHEDDTESHNDETELHNDDTELHNDNYNNISEEINVSHVDMNNEDIESTKIDNSDIDLDISDFEMNSDENDKENIDSEKYSESNLKNKTLKELKLIAQDIGIKTNGSKSYLTKMIIENQ